MVDSPIGRDIPMGSNPSGGAADCPGPWLRTYVEFQVDARINQAMRELAFVAEGGPGRVGWVEWQEISENHTSLLRVVEGLVAEMSQLQARGREFESALRGWEVQQSVSEVRERLPLVERELASLAQALTMHGHRLELLEHRVSEEATTMSIADRLSRLEGELGLPLADCLSTSDTRPPHMTIAVPFKPRRLEQLEQEVASSLEAHVRHKTNLDLVESMVRSFAAKQAEEAEALHSAFARLTTESRACACSADGLIAQERETREAQHLKLWSRLGYVEGLQQDDAKKFGEELLAVARANVQLAQDLNSFKSNATFRHASSRDILEGT
eukprot:CAMPEP_0115239134 /NCGR_PEP_ID=MMETSP0270-20121206/37242_1 /TAXON_ID=71861 /ORGANISM="Scrippsiella trochoidea, Strain CCMP3099" /LENGTH=326 /DNA_ID=CAMNT_0002654083 /DNA_START=1 /DNA_END=978 /DNA_ORIENTATION=-